MAAQSRSTLKYQFRTDQPATEAKFADLIDSFKLVQTPVSSPSTSGQALEFISTISQNAEGVISATKKSVNLSGYQTNDIQVVEKVTVNAGQSMTFNHKKGHYPTIRLIVESTGEELDHIGSSCRITHVDTDTAKVTFAVSGTFLVVFD